MMGKGGRPRWAGLLSGGGHNSLRIASSPRIARRQAGQIYGRMYCGMVNLREYTPLNPGCQRIAAECPGRGSGNPGFRGKGGANAPFRRQVTGKAGASS